MWKKLGSIGVPAVMAIAASIVDTAPAAAADVCLSQPARDAVMSCPKGMVRQSVGKRPVPSFNSVPRSPPPKTKTTLPAPSAANEAKQLRRNLASVRSVQLLITYIQGLESLLATTPARAPDRPGILRRLAEGYVELEASALQSQTQASINAQNSRRKDPKAAAAFDATAAKSGKTVVASRQAAIKHYTQLKTQHPKWCQTSNAADPTKSTGCADEVLYYLAYEYEQGNQLEQARKIYFELIQSHPTSRYIPNAYLAFGELFFNEAQGDPTKWSLAEQAYKEVIKYPAPKNTMYGYARYKLAFVYWNKGDLPLAMNEFKKTIDYGIQNPTLPNATHLAQSSRRDILPVYALGGDPKKAYEFVRPISGDAGTTHAETFRMLDDLGQNYLDTGHYKEGIDLYQDLMSRDRGPSTCKYQTRITEATLAMKSGSKDAIKAELDRQVDAYGKFTAAGHPEKVKLRCANDTASLLTETAMAWHLEAVGSGGVRGTGDKKTMFLTTELYKKVITTFQKEDFASFEFPRIVKEDWPTVANIKYYMADLLYSQNDWEHCGPAFDDVVSDDPGGARVSDAAHAAAVCYQKKYLAGHAGRSDRTGAGVGTELRSSGAPGAADALATRIQRLKPKELSADQKSMVGAFDRYVCAVKPSADDRDAQTQYVDVKYARARVYFEMQQWEAAAVGFRDIAINHPSQEAAIYAGQLYLESLNILAASSEPAKPACYDDMSADVPKLVELHCTGAKAKDNTEQCSTLARVQRDLEWTDAARIVERAAKSRDALQQYEKGAAAYMAIWAKYGDKACEAKLPGCNRMEDVLYNAAKAYQAARLVAKAISVRQILIDPRYHLERTGPAKQAVREIGGSYQAIAVYDEAASYYERFARESPEVEGAAEALRDAIVLRLGTGQDEVAIADADLYQRTYGQKQPAVTAHIALAIGAHYADREDYEQVKKRLSASMRHIDASATPDIQVQTHALLGRAHARTNNPTAAAKEYAVVAAFYKDEPAALKKIDAVGGDDAEKTRRLGKVLMAVGEAYFFAADQRRKQVDRIRFPEYKGPGTRADVLQHINTKVADWIKKKRPAIEETERAYLRILDIKPVPPKWAIAAGSRVGQMWGKFVAEFRAAPIPKEWRQNGPSPYGDLTWQEIRGAYLEEIDRVSALQKERAKAAYKACLDYSVRYQFFDESSRTCEKWLSTNYGAEYHLVDELRGAPTRVSSGVGDRPALLNLDGSPVRSGL